MFKDICGNGTHTHTHTLGMGKMILFRELVLSVQFTITIRLFDLVVLIRSLRQIIKKKKNIFLFSISHGSGLDRQDRGPPFGDASYIV